MSTEAFRGAKYCRTMAAGVVALLLATVSRADDQDQTERTPFAVLSIASVDRVLDDLEFVLDSAGQADRMTHIRNVLLALNELDGIDRNRPLGLMFFIPAAPPHEPEAVAFVPVTSLDALEETLRVTQTLSIEHAPDSDRFEFNTPDKSLAGRRAGDWIFLTEVDSLLALSLSDHLASATADFDRHDAVLTLHRDGLPETIVDEALSKLQEDLERDLEQKDGESVVEHQFRSRVLHGIGGLIERFVADTESATIGLEISESAQRADLDIRMNARSDSQLSRMLGELARPDSRFSAIARETAPLTIATTWHLDGEPAGIASELLARVRSEVSGSIQQPREQLGPHPFERILMVLSETVDAGHMDGLVQFLDAPDGKFVLVAAAHVADADSLAVALQEIMQHVANESRDGLVTLNALEASGVRLHRVRGKNVRRQDRRLYGDDVAFYIGAGREAVWLAMGGAHTETALRRVISAPPGDPQPTGGRAERRPLLKASLHLSHWVALAGDGETERERKLAQAARLAFGNTGEDGVDLELFADETGLQLNIEADRGYIRLLGVALAARIPD